MVFLAYVGMLYEPIDTLANLDSGIASAQARAERVFEVIDASDSAVQDSGQHNRQYFDHQWSGRSSSRMSALPTTPTRPCCRT